MDDVRILGVIGNLITAVVNGRAYTWTVMVGVQLIGPSKSHSYRYMKTTWCANNPYTSVSPLP